MAATSKQKGSRLEYKVRDVLNEHFHSKEFQRTPGSGAYMGKSNYQKKSGLHKHAQQALGADIICPTWFKFCIECKNYSDKPSFNQIIHNKDASLDKWLGEVLYDAINFEKTPLLIFNTTRKGTFAVLPHHFIKHITPFIPQYLKYDEFVIIGFNAFVDNCTSINSINDTLHSEILDWMNRSIQVKELTRTEK